MQETEAIGDMDLIDRAALLLSTGLMLVGVVVLGAVELIAGKPYQPTDAEGTVLDAAAVDPAIRTGLVVAGLLVLLVWAGYKVATPASGAGTGETATRETM